MLKFDESELPRERSSMEPYDPEVLTYLQGQAAGGYGCELV